MKIKCCITVFIILCLACSSVSADLVANGDAETGALDDWFYSGGIYVAADNGPSLAGSNCFAVPTGDDMRTAPFAVIPGESRTLTYDYKTTAGTTGGIFCLLRYWDAGGGWLGQSGGTITGTGGVWQTVTIADSVAPIGAAGADIAIFPGDFAGEFKFDNFDIEIAVSPFGVLVANGDAEAVTPLADWYHSGGVYEAADNGPTLAGVKCFAVPTGNDMRTVNFAVTPGQTLNAFVDYKSTAGTTGQIYCLLRYWDATGTGWQGQSGGTLDPTDGAWETVFIENSVVPANAVLADVAMFSAGFAGEFRFDNVLLAVPSEDDVSLNILANPGAESDFSSWYHAATGVNIASDGYESSKSFEVVRTEYDPDRDLRSVSYSAVPGNTYALNYKYKMLAGSIDRPQVALRFWGEGGAGVGSFEGQAYALLDDPNDPAVWADGPTLVYTAPEAATNLDVLVNCLVIPDNNYFEGTVRVDDFSLVNLTKLGDVDGDGDVDPNDLTTMAREWLDNGVDDVTLLPDFIVDDFEFYADSSDPNFWQDGSGSYIDKGDSIVTLVNDVDAYEGSQYLSWDYDSTDPTNLYSDTWTEFHKMFDAPFDMTPYDEFSVMVRRAFGNSEENIFYFKFYNEGTGESDIEALYEMPHADGSSYADPGQWVEVKINLQEDLMYYQGASFSSLTDIRGMFFGVVGNAAQGEGTGTIDFDSIKFIDTTPDCLVAPQSDLSGDCQVNLIDFAIMAGHWMEVF